MNHGANQGSAHAATDEASHDCDALFVLSAFGVGGSEKKVARVLTALLSRGASPAICALGPPYTLSSALPQSARAWRLDRDSRISLRTLGRLRDVLLKLRPRTVFAVDLFALLYVAIALRMAGLRDTRRVVLINTTDFVRRRDRLFMNGYAYLLRHSDLLVFGSFRQRDAWQRRYRLAGVPNVVIHNGVDAAHFTRSPSLSAQAAREQAGIAATRFVIGTVGRIAPEKNYAALVRALARLRGEGLDVHLLIVGDGPLREAIQTEARVLGMSGFVTLAGEVSDIRPLLTAMSVFALPSAVETFSNAALEAMAMSLPVVLTDTGGAREMVSDGCEGFVVPVGDEQSLHGALRALCVDSASLHAMGRAARARVEKEFAFERMVAAYRAIISRPGNADGCDIVTCK